MTGDDGAVMMRIVVNAVDDVDDDHHITRSCSRTFGLLAAQQCMKPDDRLSSTIIVCNLLWYSHLLVRLLLKSKYLMLILKLVFTLLTCLMRMIVPMMWCCVYCRNKGLCNIAFAGRQVQIFLDKL